MSLTEAGEDVALAHQRVRGQSGVVRGVSQIDGLIGQPQRLREITGILVQPPGVLAEVRRQLHSLDRTALGQPAHLLHLRPDHLEHKPGPGGVVELHVLGELATEVAQDAVGHLDPLATATHERRQTLVYLRHVVGREPERRRGKIEHLLQQPPVGGVGNLAAVLPSRDHHAQALLARSGHP
jgi:hypothetical protein